MADREQAARAPTESGDRLFAAGKEREACALYEEALAARLTELDPKRVDWETLEPVLRLRLALAKAQRNSGDVRAAATNAAAAITLGRDWLDSVDDRRALLAKLLDLHAMLAGWSGDHDDRATAARHRLEALETARKLANLSPDPAAALRVVTPALTETIRVEIEDGALDQAMARLAELEALAIEAARLSACLPSDLRATPEFHLAIADALLARNNPLRARQSFGAAIAAGERLFAATGGAYIIGADLSRAYERRAAFLGGLGDEAQAIQDLEHALAARVLALSKSRTEGRAPKDGLDLGQFRSAVLDLHRSEAEDTLANFERPRIWELHERLAEALVRHERAEEALKHTTAALETCDALIAEDPKRASWAVRAIECKINQACVLTALSREEEALAQYLDAADLTEPFLKRNPNDPVFAWWACEAYERAGADLDAAGRHEDAATLFETALRIAERLVEAEPDNPGRRLDLARLLGRAGAALAAGGDTEGGLPLLHLGRDIAASIAAQSGDASLDNALREIDRQIAEAGAPR